MCPEEPLRDDHRAHNSAFDVLSDPSGNVIIFLPEIKEKVAR